MARVAAPARVIFVNRFFHPDVSATSQMLSHLAGELVDHGLDVVVVTSRQLYEDPLAALRQRQVWRGVDVRRIRSTRFGRRHALGRLLDYLSFHAAVAAWLSGRLRPDDVVIAKTDPPLLSITVGLAARLRGARLVNWLQDVFPEVATRLGVGGGRARVALELLQYLRDRSLRAAALNVVIGERMRAYLIERAVAAESLRVITNTVGWASASPLPASASELRARLDLADVFVVAYSGNLGRAHDVDAIADCIRQIGDAEGIRFVMIGGGVGMRQLQAEAARQGWRHVSFLPYQDNGQLRDSLAAADVHLVSLLPELEGLIVPSKAYGVMAAGRPLVFIGDPAGEIARSVCDANCGVVVPSGDGAALAAALRRLASDVAECARLGRRAREAFLSHYAPRHVVALWVDALRRLAPRAGEQSGGQSGG